MSLQDKECFLSKKLLRQLCTLNTAELFDQIYAQHYWGRGKNKVLFSGTGSHDKTVVIPYVEQLGLWLRQFNPPPVVVDLGCGDFAVGSQLLQYVKYCYACDVSPLIIEQNKQDYQHENLEFLCLDMEKDEIPEGNIVIIRQVLQHLSNEMVSNILSRLAKFDYLVLTEHLPNQPFLANKDKAAGPDTRLRIRSGVVITEPPFCYPVKSTECLCEVRDSHGLIRTLVYRFQKTFMDDMDKTFPRDQLQE